MTTGMDPDLLEFYDSIRERNREHYEIVDQVRTLILRQAPHVTESLRSDRVVFSVNETHSFFIRPRDEYVAIGIINGGAIPDPGNYLLGSSQKCQIVKLSAREDAESSEFRMLIQNAIQILNREKQ